MNLRKRLIYQTSSIFGLVFALSSLVVYMVYYKNSEKIIFNELETTTLLSAYFYLEEDELSQREHGKIRDEFKQKIQNSKVKIFNENNQFAYGDSSTGLGKYLDQEILDKTRKLGKYKFKSDGNYFYGIHYPDNQGDFVVYVTTENEFFESQNKQLIYILLGSLLIGLFLIIVLSFYLSRFAYQSISQIANQMDSIDIQSKNTNYLVSNHSDDEIQKMVLKFNELLKRLSDNFQVQRNFINYLSHEIKTPLASISGNLEVFGQKDRNPEQYKEMSLKALDNVYEIENIIQNLLILSGLEKTETSEKKLRVDDLVWKISDKIIQRYPKAQDLLQFNFQLENPDLFEIHANPGQLELAIYNLIENSVKYSNQKPITLTFSEQKNRLKLSIKDQGIGIPKSEINSISEAFQRASNSSKFPGTGIGLALALLIFKQNKIDFSMNSELNQGTEIQLIF